MLIAVAGLLLALTAVLLVLEPILRAARGERIVRAESLLVEDDTDDDPKQLAKTRALAALREIEFDKATGKLSDEDYAKLYEKYSADAVAAMKDVETARRGDVDTDAVEALIASARSSAPVGPKFCEDCGATLEGSKRFCPECGVAVGASR